MLLKWKRYPVNKNEKRKQEDDTIIITNMYKLKTTNNQEY